MADFPANTVQLQALLDQGDEQAYEELLSIASSRLHKLARKMLRDYPRLRRWEQTDDVFQTAALTRFLHFFKQVLSCSANLQSCRGSLFAAVGATAAALFCRGK